MFWMPYHRTIKIINADRFIKSSGRLTNLQTSRTIVRNLSFSTKMADKGYIFCKTLIIPFRDIPLDFKGKNKLRVVYRLLYSLVLWFVSTLLVVTCKKYYLLKGIRSESDIKFYDLLHVINSELGFLFKYSKLSAIKKSQ